MARNLTAGMITEVTAATLAPVLLCELQFDSGTSYIWTGIGDLSWNAQTWQGIGNFGTVEGLEETIRDRAAGIRLGLSGIPSAQISWALQEEYQQRTVRLYFGVLDTSNQIVSNPFIIFRGLMDVLTIEEDGKTASLKMACENRLAPFERAKPQYYTSERQKFDFPGDRGFDGAPGLQNKEFNWGQTG